MIDFARRALDTFDVDYATFSERALWAAGESQKPTAIPALVAVAALSLLLFLLLIMGIRLVTARVP